ncbi:MAG: citramalate synthase [Alphaproteobacteria bacterium]|nr:citramalate synthase [Alphaproteobacteria bacterium]
MAERIHIFDTTLRDGAQTRGVDFSVDDKRAIARALDEIKIDYIEGGWPGANPVDDAFFQASPGLSYARFTAFGMTRRPDHSAANDPGINALISTAADSICMVGKTWDFHVDVAFGIPREDNLAMIVESVAYAGSKKDEVLFDAEHFFDGYKANPDYALSCLKAAHEAGARWVVLCDTNGGALPHEVTRIVSEVLEHIPGDHVGIHTHDDTGNAVANTLAAVEAGVRHVQGTLNGLGERCGNANLVTVLPNLMLKYDGAYETGLGPDELRQLTHVSRLLDELLNRAPDRTAPYVGEAAFTHKGGLHVSAVQKDPVTYEHVDPDSVGNARHIVVSDQAGRSNILSRLADANIDVDSKDKRLSRLVEDVKSREFEGYTYDGAEASFELLACRALGEVPSFYKVESFRSEVERRFNARGEVTTISQAVVKMAIDGEPTIQVAEGNGPVNALDEAMRKSLLPKYPELETMRLVDFKVRILTPQQATAAVTRVMIESTDETGHRWGTVGISPNIIDAAYEALGDAIVYKLLRARA